MEALCAAASELVGEGLILTTAGGEVLEANGSACRMFGLPRDEIVGLDICRLAGGGEDSWLPSSVGDVTARQGTPVTVANLTGLRADDTDFPLRVQAVPTSVARGPAWALVATDLSSQDAAEKAKTRESRTRYEAEIRVEAAGELHDGVLQTLTAATLQLEVARRLVREDPEGAVATLVELGSLLTEEQRELRLFVDELRLDGPYRLEEAPALRERLESMLDRIRRIWGVAPQLTLSKGLRLDSETERALLRLIQEGAVNASRHAHATRITVGVWKDAETLMIEIEDDGEGFPFQGTFDHEVLVDRRLGPLSLKRRVIQHGGRLRIDSSATGSTLNITMPVQSQDPGGG